MAESNDSTLLREYSERHSETAFAELVQRHVSFVYSVALRHVGSPADAQDVAQAVFVILAKKSARLYGRATLTGWFYETTRFTSRQHLRTKVRRLEREQKAYMRSASEQPGDEQLWPQLAPHLEEAMSRLRAADRELLALRFFENKTGAEAAALLGIGGAAAHKRTIRALDKLRDFFARLGVTSTTAAIAENISAHAVPAAPAGLAKTISAGVLAKGASASTAILVQGTLKVMTLIKVKKAIGLGLGALLLVGTTTLVAQHELQPSRSFPYKTADAVWQLIHSVDKTKLEMHAFIYSTNRTVHSRDLQVIIQSAAKGAIAVPLGRNGEMVDIPHDEALRRENPTITVTPPQGIRITFRGDIPVPESFTFRYNQLGDGVAEANHLFAMGADSSNGGIPFAAFGKFKSQGVFFIFAPAQAEKATVEIMAASGTKTYQANRSSGIRLKLDAALLRENPEVRVSAKPLLIRLDVMPTLEL